MNFDLSAAIDLVPESSVTVTRFALDSYDDHGVANARTVAATLALSCSVQPIGGEELERLGFAFKSHEVLAVWSATRLLMRDRLAIAGRAYSYEVFHVDAWSDVGAYSKVLVKRLAEQEPNP